MRDERINELVFQALETELGGVQIYETALRCAQNDDLRKEWEKYREQTTRHVELITGVVEAFGLDTSTETPGRLVVRHIGESLVRAMEMALEAGDPAAAEVVAAECVVQAETKDHLNWELLQEAAAKLPAERRRVVQTAVDEVEDQEDEHLYHTKGWCRELWMQSLGLKAVLPPPEEQKHVVTAIGAARAEQARTQMTSKS
jgi:rubrerythrin